MLDKIAVTIWKCVAISMGILCIIAVIGISELILKGIPQC